MVRRSVFIVVAAVACNTSDAPPAAETAAASQVPTPVTIPSARPSATATTTALPKPVPGATRHELMRLEDKRYVHMGTVSIGPDHKVTIVSAEPAERDAVERLVQEANTMEHHEEGIPKAGTRERRIRAVPRGTPLFFMMQRDWLLGRGIVLARAGTKRAKDVTHVDAHGVRVYLKGMFPSEPTDEVPVSASSPPGGPLYFRVARYDDVGHDDDSLEKYVLDNHGKQPHFVAGKVGPVSIAGRKLLAMTFMTGKSLAQSGHVVALWPKSPAASAGFVLHFSRGADKLESAEGLLAHESLATAADSLLIQ